VVESRRQALGRDAMDFGCKTTVDSVAQRRILIIALGLNATMFVVGLTAGLVAQSTGLIADSLDMLADAAAYSIALSAVNRGALFKARAASVSGGVLLALGIGVWLDAVRRGVLGSSPESGIMMSVASISLVVNATVLYLLGRYRDREVHLRATWIFTRVDVIANLAVILSGLTILLTGFRFIDLIVGSAIGLYIVKEALEILREAREAGAGDS
jgi:cation diffusion facilitator family transporter